MAELLADSGELATAATLHRLPPASPRATKERVEVRIEDRRVGELSRYMAEHFLPLIRACEEQGIAVVTRAVVRGNQLKSDVVLNATKAIDLPAGWIDKHINGAEHPPEDTT